MSYEPINHRQAKKEVVRWSNLTFWPVKTTLATTY